MTGAPSVLRGVNQPGLGDFNQRVVADAIRRVGATGISRTELASATGLAPQTITNVVRRLMAAGLVREAGVVSRGPGKPRRLLQLNPDGAFAIGIHIDPSVVDVIVMDLCGEIRARTDRDIQDQECPTTTLRGVADCVQDVVRAAGIDAGRVVGVGVAAPGPIDVARRLLINPPLMPRWHQTSVGDQLERLTGLPVLLLKDVAAGAVGELWLRRFDQPGSFIFCYLGTGIGVATTVAGTVQVGVDGNAGEVGPYVGTATSPGDWVRRSAALGLQPAVPVGPLMPRRIAHAVGELVRLAEAGQPDASGLFRVAGRALGRALAQYSDLFDISEIVLGGPYWEVVEHLVLPGIQHQLDTLPVLSAVRPVTAHTCLHGRDVSAIGAASQALQNLLLPATGHTPL